MSSNSVSNHIIEKQNCMMAYKGPPIIWLSNIDAKHLYNNDRLNWSALLPWDNYKNITLQ